MDPLNQGIFHFAKVEGNYWEEILNFVLEVGQGLEGTFDSTMEEALSLKEEICHAIQEEAPLL